MIEECLAATNDVTLVSMRYRLQSFGLLFFERLEAHDCGHIRK